MSGREIKLTGLSKQFRGPPPLDTVAVTNVTFAAGQTTAFVGPSGCGKSTLLRMIAGLEAPTTGDILIGDETPHQLAKRGGLSMAFQDPSLLPWRTVRSNVALGQKLARQSVDAAAIDKMLALVGLSGFEEQRPATLSGGMRQRAAIARCLISTPELILLDEPFASVDALTRSRLNGELPPLWRKTATTALLVTHSVTEAVLLSDRIIVLSKRPATVVRDIAVQFDQPRDTALTRGQTFTQICDQVTEALALAPA